MKRNELNQNLEVSARDTFNMLLCRRRKAGRHKDSALAGSAGKTAPARGREEGKCTEARCGDKTIESRDSRSLGEAPRWQADREAHAAQDPAFAPTGPPATGYQAVVTRGRVGEGGTWSGAKLPTLSAQ